LSTVDPVLAPCVSTLPELHQRMQSVAPLSSVTRIAVVVYDRKTDLLRTFMHSNAGDSPLNHYSARLSDVPSLKAMADSGMPRVVTDLRQLNAPTVHSRGLIAYGYRSSYTVPLLSGRELQGFLFFNSPTPDFFTPAILSQLWPYTQIAKLLALLELDKIRLIQTAVNTVRRISFHRDEETAEHLDRMSRYGLLIAETLADDHGLTDEFVEYLFYFSSLHDAGKIGIPDNILFKPGPLDADEYAMMKTHVEMGRDIVDRMVAEFGIAQIPHVDILRNIVAYHHEAWDGTGYPAGLCGEQIPLEARIAAVADVFDALTSRRPYKAAWTVDQAFEHLKAMSGRKFYPPCVEALLCRRTEVEDVLRLFAEAVVE
jgi:HD-GYP domain-containing protein (c-di-GMP phosphodiesterase class II)